MNILFYTPVNFRCRDIESLAERLVGDGHSVYFLSTCPEGPFHEAMRRVGVTTFVAKQTSGSIAGIFQKVRELMRFCKREKIDVCFSHLEPTNFTSVLVQNFVKTKFILYRHHIDEARLAGFDKSISYRLTYKLGKTIVCVSRQAKQYMIEREGVIGNRIHHINLGYNFSLYELPSSASIEATRSKFPDGIVLLFAGRLTAFKRPALCIELVKKALNENIKCSIVFLGVGPDEQELRTLAKNYGVSDRVFFIGYTNEILTYMASADLLLHPSLLESSCVVVKEASLVGLPVVVCGGVGDFDDYLENNRNSIVVTREHFVENTLEILRNYKAAPEVYRQLGTNLRADIISRFHIETVIDQYYRLLKV